MVVGIKIDSVQTSIGMCGSLLASSVQALFTHLVPVPATPATPATPTPLDTQLCIHLRAPDDGPCWYNIIKLSRRRIIS